ncbi:hypothetical protein CGLO_09931 [Colletotrichum gloeosporioides Cg-14]|uniref:Uncharacterized protein n=1 Tax=Colletotrichum gloeosporioides (strain Cg-14) TaxID=1237896 RepID=T0LG77_COLGC|nr:hypothetical protein CGLO_09931 [Colletotrichum gloeosporioides Cg-14]
MSFSYNACSQIPESLEPYGDIAGLGVVLSFVISAWLTILVLVGYYVFAFDPDVDPFQRNRSTTTPYSPNPLDVLIAKYTKYLRVLKDFKGSLAEDAFHKCILALADAQLITGMSILMSGYMSLKHERGLSAYHWKIVVSLAWFSSVTHLSALTFLRSYLAKHSSRRLWRLTLMLILLVLLFVGFLPTGHFDFLGSQLDNDPSSFYYRQPSNDVDQIGYSHIIDLGQFEYPQDCENDNKNPYYAIKWLNHQPKVYYNLTSLDAELLRNGTIGPKNCTISGISILKHEISLDTINLYKIRYLRILKDVTHGESMSEVEVAILYESPAVCFFKGGLFRPFVGYLGHSEHNINEESGRL